MFYSLLYRFGKPLSCVPRLTRVTCCPLSTLHLYNSDLIHLNPSPRAQGACCVLHHGVLPQSRNVHIGAECTNKAQPKNKEMSDISRSRPSPGLSAAQKGTRESAWKKKISEAVMMTVKMFPNQKNLVACLSSEAGWERCHVSARGACWTWSYRWGSWSVTVMHPFWLF